jgi:hypothetical protein
LYLRSSLTRLHLPTCKHQQQTTLLVACETPDQRKKSCNTLCTNTAQRTWLACSATHKSSNVSNRKASRPEEMDYCGTVYWILPVSAGAGVGIRATK